MRFHDAPPDSRIPAHRARLSTTRLRRKRNIATTVSPIATRITRFERQFVCRHNEAGQTFRPGLLLGGAAGNRTRVLRHSLKTSPCAVRYVSTWISQSRKQAEMTIPVAVVCPVQSRDRTERWIPLADARVRAEGLPGLTDTPSLRQRGRSRADWNRRLIGCNDAYGGLLPAPARFP